MFRRMRRLVAAILVAVSDDVRLGKMNGDSIAPILVVDFDRAKVFPVRSHLTLEIGFQGTELNHQVINGLPFLHVHLVAENVLAVVGVVQFHLERLQFGRDEIRHILHLIAVDVIGYFLSEQTRGFPKINWHSNVKSGMVGVHCSCVGVRFHNKFRLLFCRYLSVKNHFYLQKLYFRHFRDFI